MSKVFIIIAASVVFVALLLPDAHDSQELAFYCEMVDINKDDPERGWPDYRRIWDNECG